MKKSKFEICDRKARRLKRRKAQGRGPKKLIVIDEFHMMMSKK